MGLAPAPGHRDGSVLLMAMLVFSLASDLPRVTGGGVAAAALGLGHPLFSRHAATGLADLEVVPALVVLAYQAGLAGRR